MKMIRLPKMNTSQENTLQVRSNRAFLSYCCIDLTLTLIGLHRLLDVDGR